jgi:hypothetical protein
MGPRRVYAVPHLNYDMMLFEAERLLRKGNR